MSVFYHASEGSTLELVLRLNNLYNSIISKKDIYESLIDEDNHGNNLLHIACYNGNLELVKYLVDLLRLLNPFEPRTSILKKNKYEHTSLHYACYSSNLELVKYLVDIVGEETFLDFFSDKEKSIIEKSIGD